jgi:hypothetical protein
MRPTPVGTPSPGGGKEVFTFSLFNFKLRSHPSRCSTTLDAFTLIASPSSLHVIEPSTNSPQRPLSINWSSGVIKFASYNGNMKLLALFVSGTHQETLHLFSTESQETVFSVSDLHAVFFLKWVSAEVLTIVTEEAILHLSPGASPPLPAFSPSPPPPQTCLTRSR